MNQNRNALPCPVNATLSVIGGKYKLLILWHLINGPLRYGELRKQIPTVTPNMLTQQLREMEGDNLLKRTVFPVIPAKVEYALTDSGASLHCVLAAMYNWGVEHILENEKQLRA